ncbi:armadillo-type protein [Chytridium lagenaria]|nr:armadillo-type protein [Chytridium lagenaria]
MADTAETEDFSGLSLSERLTHKSWKARQGGYEELAKLFRTLDPDADAEYKKYQEYLKKMATDTNIAAQDAGLTALLAYIENAPSAARTRNVVAPLIVEKALGSARASNRATAVEILLMYVEVENKADGVIEDLIPGLDNKTPKNVVACINVMKEAIRMFGIKVVNVKLILKQLPKMFDHKDKNVRAEASALTVEMYRWLGKALMPSIGELKPLQLKDLAELFESLPQDRPKPERLIRAEQAKREAVGYVAEEEVGPVRADEPEPEPVDPFDISDPVNVLDKLPPKFYEELASTKWKERKEILEALLPLVKYPKLEEGRYGELLNVLSKRINDANILVTTLAVNCIENIARGLRSSFAQYRGIVLSALLEKLKEKKATVIEAIRGALDALFLCVSFTEIIEDVATASAHKNPQVKLEAIQYLVRCLRVTRKPPGKPEMKAIADVAVKSLDDGDAGVRDAAAELLGTLMRVVTERPLAAFLEKLDPAKLVKKPAVAKGPASTQRPKAMPPKGVTRPSTAAPTRKPTSASSSSRPSTSSGPSKSSDAPKKKTTESVLVEEKISFKYSDDSAEAWMQEHFGEVVVLAEIGDANWKVRLAAVQKLLETVNATDLGSIEAEAVIRFLLKTPGWKESNFQVMTGVVNVLIAVAKCKSFSKSVASLAVPGLCDKISDMKVKKVSSECLTTFCEMASFQFVLSQMYEPLKKAKSPKTLADGIMWIYQSLMEFGIAGLTVRDLVEFAKVALGNSNSAVRNNAVTLLGGLRQFVGPDLKALLSDLSGPLMATVDSEFEKVAAREPPKPTKAQSAAVGGSSEDPADELFPRVDLMTVVPADLLDKLGDAQWKVRKEGLEDLAKFWETQKRIKPNLAFLSVTLSNIFSSMAGLLADQKNHIRSAALAAIENSITVDQPQLRKDLLKWFTEKIEIPILVCLQDKNADVRKPASVVLLMLAETIGLNSVENRAKDMATSKAASSAAGVVTASEVGPAVSKLKLPGAAGGAKKSSPYNRQLLEFLREQCEGNISAGIISLMFSTDHYKEKDFISALGMLDDGIVAAQKFGGYRAYSWLTFCLELLEHLFALLDSQDVHLTEYEASAFLPFFIGKTGDNKETMRVKIRGILKQICRVYPASKLFNYLLEGLKSKNSRTRTECLEELADIIKKNGISVCAPAKVFPVIAAQISDSDAKVRNGALGVVTQAYMFVGDAVYKYVGRLSDKDKSLIEEKLKRLPPPTLSAPQPLTREAKSTSSSVTSLDGLRQHQSGAGSRASVQSLEEIMPTSLTRLKERAPVPPNIAEHEAPSVPVKKEFSLDLDKLNRPRMTSDESSMGSLPRSTSVSSSLQNLRAQLEQSNLSTAPAVPMDRNSMDIIVTQITAGDAYQSIDALKNLERLLTTSVDVVAPHLDEIISAITLQIRIAFTAADLTSPGTGRLCKHLVNVLVQIFTLPELAKEAGIIEEIVGSQFCSRLSKDRSLLGRLNVLMVRILENCDRNKSFSILLNLLQQSTMETIKASARDAPNHAKYTELVMKCIWKMTKFLEVAPPSDWKRRASEKTIPQADMPLRDKSALEYAELIPDQNRSHAMTYLRQIVDQARKKASSGKYHCPTTTRSDDACLPPSQINPRPTSPPLSEDDANRRLTLIFHKLSQKDHTKQGIADLHVFRRNHPEAERLVKVHYEKTTPYFKGYITRSLLGLDAAAAEQTTHMPLDH